MERYMKKLLNEQNGISSDKVLIDPEAPQVSLPKNNRNRINRKLQDITSPPYYHEIPLDDIFEILEENDVMPLQEDDTLWSGLLLGADGRTTIRLALKNGAGYRKIKNSMLVLTWHKMDSGRWEVVTYLS